MYYYNVYGKKILINIELPLLESVKMNEQYDISIHVEYGNVEGEGILIRQDSEKYIVCLGELAVYYIFPVENSIFCMAKNFEAFFSTIFNIPFSVYSILKGAILYHASSLVYENKVFCLTGDKGVGKSTITEMLSSDERIHVFGDDTIYINSLLMGERAHDLMKQTPQTIQALNVKTLDIQNAAGKFYTIFQKKLKTAKIEKIIRIVRTYDSNIKLKRIDNRMKINDIFRTNIVGISYMPHELIMKCLRFQFKGNVVFYELCVPDNLNNLIESREEIIKEIISSFEK